MLRKRVRFGLPVCFAAAGVVVACATTRPSFPWRRSGSAAAGATRTDVETVNTSYRRTRSPVLVRRVRQPTRAGLDFAAYHANFMDADPPPERDQDVGKRPDASHPFAGAVVAESLTGSVATTPLSPEERTHALALAPLVELLAAKHVSGADRLEDVLGRVRAESWGLPGGPQVVRQTAVEGFLHQPSEGKPLELWLKIEFAPWFHAFSSMPDEDGDDFPEVYGRADPEAIGDLSKIAQFIRSDYEGKTLSPTEVAGWAHQLASYWYPSYNTDLVDASKGWPTDDTEPDVRKELDGLQLQAQKMIVMRGKPAGKAVYNVFLVDWPGGGGPSGAASAPVAAAPSIKLPPSKPSPDPAPVARAIRAELAAHDGSWTAWESDLSPLQTAIKARLAAVPAGAKALPGGDGYLFYARSLSYLVGGDLGKQRGDKNPIPAIVRFRDLLAKHHVDLLFVPVPTKAEIFPERAAVPPGGDSAHYARFVGQVANPYERKFLLELAEKGVETVDLLPAFLAERRRDAAAKGDGALYQAEDTHWTSRGLELAARLVAERVRRYSWAKPLAAHRRAYHTKDAPFTRHGDLCSRLPEVDQARYAPETLVGHQVVGPEGALYEDDPESPIVVLGDSFTGVYELMDCEHAGVSAHLAKELGTPIDLVMSYGGGPNVRSKLLRRGEAALGTKKLVIWMMTARDLYDFSDGWEK